MTSSGAAVICGGTPVIIEESSRDISGHVTFELHQPVYRNVLACVIILSCPSQCECSFLFSAIKYSCIPLSALCLYCKPKARGADIKPHDSYSMFVRACGWGDVSFTVTGNQGMFTVK